MKEYAKARIEKIKTSFLLSVLSTKAVTDMIDQEWDDAKHTVRYGNVLYGLPEVLHEMDTLNMGDFIEVLEHQNYTAHLILFAQYYDEVYDYAKKTGQLKVVHKEHWHEYLTILRNCIKNSYETFTPTLKDESTLRSKTVNYNYLNISKSSIGKKYKSIMSDKSIVVFANTLEEFFHTVLK